MANARGSGTKKKTRAKKTIPLSPFRSPFKFAMDASNPDIPLEITLKKFGLGKTADALTIAKNLSGFIGRRQATDLQKTIKQRAKGEKPHKKPRDDVMSAEGSIRLRYGRFTIGGSGYVERPVLKRTKKKGKPTIASKLIKGGQAIGIAAGKKAVKKLPLIKQPTRGRGRKK